MSLICQPTSEDTRHHLKKKCTIESRRDQEEGGELDSHEEASPEEIKSREVELGLTVGLLLLQLFSRINTSIVLASVHGLSGLFRAVSAVEPLTLLPPSHSVPVPNRPTRLCGRKATLNQTNGGAMDIVVVTLFCIAVGTAVAWCGGRCAMQDGHCLNILLFWRRSTTALVFRDGACFEVSLSYLPFSHSSPSLTGLLASVDVKQQRLSLKCSAE